MKEQRRGPRVVPVRECHVRFGVTRPVQVVDISASGSLVQAATAAPPAATGELRMSLGSVPFAAHVDVRRIEAGRPAGARIGVQFRGMGADSRRALQQLLDKASHWRRASR